MACAAFASLVEKGEESDTVSTLFTGHIAKLALTFAGVLRPAINELEFVGNERLLHALIGPQVFVSRLIFNQKSIKSFMTTEY